MIVLSLFWSLLNAALRRFRRPHLPLGVSVISVGNLEAGGTGKTPWVIALARWGIAQGKTPIVLTRGYGGKIARSGRSEFWMAPQELPDPEQWGDEAAWIARAVPGVCLGVGADRRRSFALCPAAVLEQGQGAVVILDDGLQQFDLPRAVDLILCTGRPWWGVLLRELFLDAPQALWIWTKGAAEPWRWKRRKHRYAVPMVVQASGNLQGKRVFLVCGVGSPESVREAVERLGGKCVASQILPDHAVFTEEACANWTLEARRHGAVLVLTAKDVVKWKGPLPESVILDHLPESAGFSEVSTRLLPFLQVN